MILERLFPATVMPDQDWWHTFWPDSDHIVKSLRSNEVTGLQAGGYLVREGCASPP